MTNHIWTWSIQSFEKQSSSKKPQAEVCFQPYLKEFGRLRHSPLCVGEVYVIIRITPRPPNAALVFFWVYFMTLCGIYVPFSFFRNVFDTFYYLLWRATFNDNWQPSSIYSSIYSRIIHLILVIRGSLTVFCKFIFEDITLEARWEARRKRHLEIGRVRHRIGLSQDTTTCWRVFVVGRMLVIHVRPVKVWRGPNWRSTWCQYCQPILRSLKEAKQDSSWSTQSSRRWKNSTSWIPQFGDG